MYSVATENDIEFAQLPAQKQQSRSNTAAHLLSQLMLAVIVSVAVPNAKLHVFAVMLLQPPGHQSVLSVYKIVPRINGKKCVWSSWFPHRTQDEAEREGEIKSCVYQSHDQLEKKSIKILYYAILLECKKNTLHSTIY
jgi:hypothetical protein